MKTIRLIINELTISKKKYEWHNFLVKEIFLESLKKLNLKQKKKKEIKLDVLVKT